MIDLGLSKRYINPQTMKHNLENQNTKKTVGTTRYISNNANLGFEHSRRDDMESIAFICIYFLRGSLPW
jgi:casein kinase I homolog HRR25